MAAAALSRSRGVAGVRTTKGLFFIFTLLSLVCLARSLTDEDQLETLERILQKGQQRLYKLKAEKATNSELVSECMSLMDPMTALMNKASPNFPQLEGFLKSIKGFMEKTATDVDKFNEELGADIGNMEQELEEVSRLIEFLEEQQAEL